MKTKLIILSLVATVFLLLAGCAEKSVGTGEKSMQTRETSQLSHAEQKEQAYDIFRQILDLSGSEDRQNNLPRIKELYQQIIDQYPEIGLAQESYLRLIIIAKEEDTASGDAEAERLYQEFVGKYPDSNLKKVLEYEINATK